jgi:hypothetical protein
LRLHSAFIVKSALKKLRELDAQMKRKSIGANWKGVGTNSLYQELCNTHTMLKEKMTLAMRGDGITSQRIADAANSGVFKTLDRPLADIEAELAGAAGVDVVQGDGSGGELGAAALLAEMGQLLERVEALLKERGALREEAETYLQEAAAAHWIYGKVYCDKMSVADASEAFLSVVERLTSAYKANDAELRQALEKLQGSSGELKGVQVISSEVQRRQALLLA